MDNNERCKKLVAAIQTLEQTEITELFKLLHASKCEYTRNNNGVFVNLSWLPHDMLNKIETYVAFCNKSRNEVKHYESLCDVLNKNIHEPRADVKTPEGEVYPQFTDPTKYDKKTIASKVSSSMRFYLLKKRFSKQTPMATTAKNDLKHDDYVL